MTGKLVAELSDIEFHKKNHLSLLKWLADRYE
jgi:hypothetical protein